MRLFHLLKSYISSFHSLAIYFFLIFARFYVIITINCILEGYFCVIFSFSLLETMLPILLWACKRTPCSWMFMRWVIFDSWCPNVAYSTFEMCALSTKNRLYVSLWAQEQLVSVVPIRFFFTYDILAVSVLTLCGPPRSYGYEDWCTPPGITQ